MTPVPPEEAHRWLHQLVGEWNYESAADGACSGTERVRKVGELWVVGESEMQMTGGETSYAIITIGYDPKRKRFVGSWIGSTMAHLWTYDGELDSVGRKLSLFAEGPSVDEQGNFSPTKTSNYCDAIEIQDKDRRIFTGSIQGPDGSWTTMMTMHYRRKQ